MTGFHAALYFERQCVSCRRLVSAQVHDYGLVTLDTLDEKIGLHDFTLKPIVCPGCGREAYPEYAVLRDLSKGAIVFRAPIGSRDMPVVGDTSELPYAVVRSPAEQEAFERGLAKLESVFNTEREAFWLKFSEWAQQNWSELIKEVTAKEFEAGYRLLGLPLLPPNSSPSAWRKDALARFQTAEAKAAAWRSLNHGLIHQEFLYLPIDQWAVRDWVTRYGRERVTYIILHLPLPEELEIYRTQALSQVIKKTSGATGVLFERIRQLGEALEKQHRRAVELSLQLQHERQQYAALVDKVSELRRRVEEQQRGIEQLQAEIAQITSNGRDPEDVRKIRELKGLVKELRAEVKRLRLLLPKDLVEEGPGEEDNEGPSSAAVQMKTADPVSVLAGRTIAVFGRLGDPVEVPYVLLWHDGDKADGRLFSMVAQANVLVVLTRLVSHEVMWELKEAAIERGIPIRFIRATGLESILAAATQALAGDET